MDWAEQLIYDTQYDGTLRTGVKFGKGADVVFEYLVIKQDWDAIIVALTTEQTNRPTTTNIATPAPSLPKVVLGCFFCAIWL